MKVRAEKGSVLGWNKSKEEVRVLAVWLLFVGNSVVGAVEAGSL